MHSLLGREKKEEEAGFGFELGLSPGFLPHAATMFSCVGCFWVLLSSALVAVCSFSFISPAWIVKDQLRNGHHQNQHQHHQHHHSNNNKDSVSFGLLWHCSESLDHMYRCYTFGGLGKFAEIPSSSWQTSAVLCSGGCALLAVSSLLAIITIFLPSGGCERRICTLAGYMQMASAQRRLNNVRALLENRRTEKYYRAGTRHVSTRRVHHGCWTAGLPLRPQLFTGQVLLRGL
uniref:Transmembrane protein 211-like n=1 Tax=Sparus aurata TaxID=8175 RepID=A0A671U0R3_SPAAU